jgi:hypothetical protein
VYVPILGGDDEASVPSAMKRLPDTRVVFYWDAKVELTKSYSQVLQLGDGLAAWDVYLVFDRAAGGRRNRPPPITGCTNSAACHLSADFTATRWRWE